MAGTAKKSTRKVAKQNPIKTPEFSKLTLALVMAAYFVAVGVGVRLSLLDFSQYSTLAMLVGAPTSTAIGFYAWKAKAENVLKIKKENPAETNGVPFDPGNMT